MSTAAIDQLFQITASARPESGTSRADKADGDAFRSHLQRATHANETKAPSKSEHEEPKSLDTEEKLEPKSDQQETSSAEKELTPATSETTQPKTEPAEEQEANHESVDEVTLSSAAAQAATQNSEIIVQAEPTVIQATITATTASDDQQQSDHQPAQAENDTAVSTKSAEQPTATESKVTASTIETPVLGETTPGEAVTTTQEPTPYDQGEQQSTKHNAPTEVDQEATATAQKGKTDSPTTTSTQSQPTAPQIPAEQQLSHQQESQSQSSSDGDKQPEQRSESSTSKTPSSKVTIEAATATDAEHTTANLHTTTDTTATAPSAAAPTTNHEAAASIGRSLGNFSASRSADSTNASSDAQTAETPTVDRARFVQRVSGAIRSAQQRDGQIQLRLSPPELGTLRIQLAVSEGVVTAHLETETAAARNILLDNLPALRERLAEQEIRIEKFDVDVGRDQQQQAENRGTEDRQNNKSRAQSNNASNANTTSTAEPTSMTDATLPTSLDGLDVRI